MIKIVLITLLSGVVLCSDLLVLHNSLKDKPNKLALQEVQKLQKLAKQYNIKIKFKGIPWKRALLMVEKGVADGLINASYKTSRAQFAYYPMKDEKLDSTRRLNSGKSYYIFKNKNATLSWDGKMFSKVDGSIAAKDGYAVIEDLKKHNNIQLITMAREELIIRKLIQGKLAAFATIGTQKKLMEQIPGFTKNVVQLQEPIRKKDYFLIFSKKTYPTKKEEIEKLWNGLKEYNK